MSEELRPRYVLLDALRGLCVLSMVVYHGMYDLVVLKGWPASWFFALPGHLWQQSICWTFIALSGFCWSLSRHPRRHGLLLLACGELVSLVTALAMPSQAVRWGVLTLLGCSGLLLWALSRLGEALGWRIPPAGGLAASLLLFLLTRDVPQGFLGFEGLRLLPLPAGLYQFPLLAGLGLPPADFSSSDYFPLIPWFFLYLAGYFLWGLLQSRPRALAFLQGGRRPEPLRLLRPLTWIGRRSLLIYLLHQPMLMAVFLLVPPYGP